MGESVEHRLRSRHNVVLSEVGLLGKLKEVGDLGWASPPLLTEPEVVVFLVYEPVVGGGDVDVPFEKRLVAQSFEDPVAGEPSSLSCRLRA